jgi:tetratricopeptide (TPR) repeat protein
MKWFTLTCAAVVLAAQVMAGSPAALAADQTDAEITRLIEQLGDAQFAVRQRAQEQLVKLGFAAFDALVEAEQHDDPEVAMQAGYLVRQIRAGWTTDSDPRQIQEILKDYEIQNDERRLAKIKELADLPDDAGLKWLCRLVRFEKSPLLSKQTALAIMEHPPVDEAGWNRRAELIHSELDRARRPAARWLETELTAHKDPAAALQRWTEFTVAEQQVLRKQPQDTSSPVVIALLKREVELLDKLGRADQTSAVIKQMVLAERGDSASLGDLIEWIVKRKAWDALDQVAERFAASFEVDATLTYLLCEARLAQGKPKLAEQMAEQALKIHGDSQQDHVLLATRLGDRGLPRWADREWQYAIQLGPAGTQWDIIARKLLANSYHDRREDAAAGKLLQELLEKADKDNAIMQRVRTAQQQQYDTSINSLRSDMYFYLACQAATDGDAQRQRALLEDSLAQNRTNIEALIALYQITAGDPKKRAELMDWSKEFIDLCRSRIDDEPENPTFYNQIAWLIANTAGNQDEAVELARKAVDLAKAQGDPPLRLGGLYDTLSHAYFAKGDYASAVKTQEEAARLDPHTQSIRRALDQFRAAAAKQGDSPEASSEAVDSPRAKATPRERKRAADRPVTPPLPQRQEKPQP